MKKSILVLTIISLTFLVISVYAYGTFVLYDDFDDNSVDFTNRWQGSGGYWSQSNPWGLTEFNNDILNIQAYGLSDTGTDQGKYVTKENVKGKDWELKIFGNNECENTYDPRDGTGYCTGPDSGPAIHVILTTSEQSFVNNIDLYTQHDIVYSGGYLYQDNPTWDHIVLLNNVVIKGRWTGNNLILDFCYGGLDGEQTCSVSNKTITGLTADTYYVGFQGCGRSTGGNIPPNDQTTWGATLCADFLKVKESSCVDDDEDNVCDDIDLCPGTKIPEETVPSKRLGINRFALIDDDTIFDTVVLKGRKPKKTFTITDTFGCSCEQILALNPSNEIGHKMFGCSIGKIKTFIKNK